MSRHFLNGFNFIKWEVIPWEKTLHEDKGDGCRTWGIPGLVWLPEHPKVLQAFILTRQTLGLVLLEKGLEKPIPGMCHRMPQVLTFQARIQPRLNKRKHPHYGLGSLTFNAASLLPQGSLLGKISPVYIHQMPNPVSSSPDGPMWVGSHKLRVNIDFPMTLF